MSDKKHSSEQQLSESLSALMDGEVTELELRRLLKADKAQIDARWMRYHLAKDTMQGQLKGQFKADELIGLSRSISDAIADEPVLNTKQAATSKSGSSFWSNLGRFAVAASVAGAVVVGVQFTPDNSNGQLANTVPGNSVETTVSNTPVPAKINTSPALSSDTSVRVVGNQSSVSKEQTPIVLNEATQEQLQQMEGDINRWMSEHAQNASQNTQQGLLPYVRVPDTEK